MIFQYLTTRWPTTVGKAFNAKYRVDFCSGSTVLVLFRYSVPISAGLPTVLTEAFRVFPPGEKRVPPLNPAPRQFNAFYSLTPYLTKIRLRLFYLYSVLRHPKRSV